MKSHKLIIPFLALTLVSSAAKAQVYDTLCPLGATWKYLDDGNSQDATSWKLSSYSDASWKTGIGPLGYGDTWMATCIDPGCTLPPEVIPCTPICLDINITNYFRKQITLTNAAAYDSVFMDAQIDDGIIMYVNGSVVWSYNMPATYNSNTSASSTINGAAESVIQHKAIPMTYFVTGPNTVAVELHQQGGTTSDATMDIRMRFKRKASPTGINTITDKATGFYLFPNPSKGNFTVASADPLFAGEDASIIVYDITGRLVAKQLIHFTEAKANVQLPLNTGMYFVHLVSGNTNTTVKINIEK